MKRLSLIGSWKRIGMQAGLLAGIGLAFVGGTQAPDLKADPPPNCKEEGMCSFKKPLFLMILDYSSSMNADFMGQGTRWVNAVNAVNTAIDSDNGFIVSNFILGLMRFGHDPSPNPGTTIPADNSGLIDGQKLDVGFYDPQNNNKYYECEQGDNIKAALAALPPPSNGAITGIGTWTEGALQFAQNYFDQTLALHPADGNMNSPRLRSILLLTDGEWTSQNGMTKLGPATDSPYPVAADLFNTDKIPTYVVAIGEAVGKESSNLIAMNGGTTAAYDAADPQALINALKMVIQQLIDQQIKPICTPGLPRVMVLLDASSSMLNLQGGLVRAKLGQGGWEQARDALAGAMSIFEQPVPEGEVQDLVHLGLAVFGNNTPDESDILVQYGPCRKDNFGWALDPVNSCGAGCNDPYANGPVPWTFQDGSTVPPNFDDSTLSHMPKCDAGTAPNKGCFGSGTYTHLGLNTVQQNIAAYKAECLMNNAPQPCSADTQFINILITDGQTNSTPAQYNPVLQAMFNGGTTTYVIGFGDGVDGAAAIASLNEMAKSGSGGVGSYYDANNQAQLEMALAQIIEGVTFDPCCSFNDCDVNAEPTTNEPDPLPGQTTGVDPSTTGDLTTTTADDSTSTGPVDPTNETNTSTSPDPDTTAETANPTTTPDDTTAGDTTGIDTPTDPSSPNPSTPTSTNPSTPDDDDDDDSGDEDGLSSSGGELTAGPGEGGCGCSTDDNSPVKGLLGTFLSLGLAGFIRRRRR